MLVGRLRFILCTIALDTGWVACGEKLNRSLCSLKIKLFLYAGGGDCGLFFAQFTMHILPACAGN